MKRPFWRKFRHRGTPAKTTLLRTPENSVRRIVPVELVVDDRGSWKFFLCGFGKADMRPFGELTIGWLLGEAGSWGSLATSRCFLMNPYHEKKLVRLSVDSLTL